MAEMRLDEKRDRSLSCSFGISDGRWQLEKMMRFPASKRLSKVIASSIWVRSLPAR